MRKELHDKLIEEFKLLKYLDNTVVIFEEVAKFLATVKKYPSCEIIPVEVTVTRDGLTMDSRYLGFRVITRDHIEKDRAENPSEFERKIDRLSDIEDAVFNYLQQIPHPLEHAVDDVQVYRIDVLPARYFYEDSTEGISIYQTIDFNLVTDIHVKDL